MEVERTPIDRVAQAAGLVALGAGAWLLVDAWAELPAAVPVHFGVSGEPDAWGPRSTVILLYVLGVVMYVALTFAERVPHTYNYPVEITEENAGRQYALGRELMAGTKAWVAVLFLFAVRVILMMAVGERMAAPMARVAALGGAYLAFLVAYFIRAGRAA